MENFMRVKYLATLAASIKPEKLFILLPLLLILTSCAGYSNSVVISEQGEQKQEPTVAAEKPFTYDDYAVVLKEYVDSAGRIDYENLKANRQKLDEFNATIATVSPSTYQSWMDKEKIAFLINAYNSLTLEAIIDNYPTESIRDIPGVWDRRKFKVMGQEMTLDQIEHQILRKEFNEPKIHMGLVCASIGCPKLSNEPFTGEQLDAQLDKQTRIFLSNPQNFRIDREQNRVYVSSIFKWFGEDFETSYGKEQNFDKLNGKETAFLNFISQYLSPAEQDYLTQGGYRVSYLDYDWSLNTQR